MSTPGDDMASGIETINAAVFIPTLVTPLTVVGKTPTLATPCEEYTPGMAACPGVAMPTAAGRTGRDGRDGVAAPSHRNRGASRFDRGNRP